MKTTSTKQRLFPRTTMLCLSTLFWSLSDGPAHAQDPPVDPDVITVALLIEITEFETRFPPALGDELVGIVLDGNDDRAIGAFSVDRSCGEQFWGTYVGTDGLLITTRGAYRAALVTVKADRAAPIHGFLDARHFQDIHVCVGSESGGVFHRNDTNGGWAMVFITIPW